MNFTPVGGGVVREGEGREGGRGRREEVLTSGDSQYLDELEHHEGAEHLCQHCKVGPQG